MVDTVEAIKAAEADADDKQKAIDSFDNYDVKSSKEDKKLAPSNIAKRKLCENEDEDNLSIDQGKKFSSDNDEFFKSSSSHEKKTKVMEDQDDLLREEYEYSCYYNGDGVSAGDEYKESAFTDKDDIAYDMVTSFDYDLSDFMY